MQLPRIIFMVKQRMQQIKQESPPIGGEMRNAMTLISERLLYIMLAITCSENVYARLCSYSYLRLECDNNKKMAIYVTRRRRQVHLRSIFGDKRPQCLILAQHKMTHLNHHFQNCKPFRNRLNRYLEIPIQTRPKMDTFMRFAADRK